MGNNGTNNINMDNKISKNINKNRHRNIIWFKPPFYKLQYQYREIFSRFDKHFKDDNALRKIINKNNVKMSCSCTDDMSKIIDNYNKN